MVAFAVNLVTTQTPTVPKYADTLFNRFMFIDIPSFTAIDSGIAGYMFSLSNDGNNVCVSLTAPINACAKSSSDAAFVATPTLGTSAQSTPVERSGFVPFPNAELIVENIRRN